MGFIIAKDKNYRELSAGYPELTDRLFQDVILSNFHVLDIMILSHHDLESEETKGIVDFLRSEYKYIVGHDKFSFFNWFNPNCIYKYFI